MTLNEAKRILQNIGRRKVLREDESKSILKLYGIPTTNFCVISSVGEINNIKLNFPVALKVCSERFVHKTDVGGVKLNIGDFEELRIELEKMENRFYGERFLIETMETQGIELIVGLFRDRTFGLCIMFGIGGVLTELYRDVSFRVLPINEHDGNEMLKELKAGELFEGFREMKVDKDGIINLMLKVSKLGEELEEYIDQMDMNPVFAREKDIVVVDAKMILR